MTSFHDRLQLNEATGAWFDQTRRYMLIRPDALMGVFRRLPPEPRALALAALADSIFDQGLDSAQAYMATGGGKEALLGIIAETAPQLGWGRWIFKRDGDTLTLEVENSPFAAGFGPSDHPVCAAIAGMVRAVSRLVIGRAMPVIETECAACAASRCRFVATPIEDVA